MCVAKPSCIVAMNQGHGNWFSSILFCRLNHILVPYHLWTIKGVNTGLACPDLVGIQFVQDVLGLHYGHVRHTVLSLQLGELRHGRAHRIM